MADDRDLRAVAQIIEMLASRGLGLEAVVNLSVSARRYVGLAHRLHVEVRHPAATGLAATPPNRARSVEVDADRCGERIRLATGWRLSRLRLRLVIASATVRRSHQIAVSLRLTRQERAHMMREDGLIVGQARTGHAS